MTPFETAARWHNARSPDVLFTVPLEAHLQTGYVFNTPELFIMARRISTDWPEDCILDPWLTNPEGDAWHVWLYAGEILAIPPLIPYFLPYVTFHRKGKFKIHRMEHLLRFLPRQ
jgi:hypothetical protein